MIYLDNAATSYPKPPHVLEAISRCLKEQGANPGRGAHQMALAASRVIFSTREKLARLFNVSDSANIIFTLNATDALNLALKGFLKKEDHVITTMVEHNSVTRPLLFLQKTRGVEVTKVKCNSQGYPDLKEMRRALRKNTKLIAVTHASNVIGAVLPISDIAEISQSAKVPLLVDAAQTAGCFPIDVKKLGISLLAFTGHKALLGPQGTGGLYIHPRVELEELRQGGTGSESDKGAQPRIRPDRYESGTPNTPGIAGLGGALEFLAETGIEEIRKKEKILLNRLWEGLQKLPNLVIYGPDPQKARVPLVSLNVEGITGHKLAFLLDKGFNIAARAGLHCAPDAHRTLGTFKTGALRLSLSYFNSEDDIDAVLDALKRIQKEC